MAELPHARARERLDSGINLVLARSATAWLARWSVIVPRLARRFGALSVGLDQLGRVDRLVLAAGELAVERVEDLHTTQQKASEDGGVDEDQR